MASKQVEIDVEIVHETEKAYLVSNGAVENWVPKSAVTDHCEEGGVINSIFISEYLATEKGLI